jgi:Rap1a immunity proteins
MVGVYTSRVAYNDGGHPSEGGGEERRGGMKTLCGLAMVGLVLLRPVVARAGEDGRTLLSTCSVAIALEDPDRRRHATPQEAYDHGYCQGVIAGIIDRSTYLTIAPAYRYCLLPGGLFPSQAIRVVHQYLQAHPDQLHRHHNDLVIEALHDAFPCTPAASRLQK